MLTLLLIAVLSQEPEAPPAEASPEPPPQAATVEADAGPAASPVRNRNADEVTALMRRLPSMTQEERRTALAELQKKLGTLAVNPVLPPADFDFEGYRQLEPAAQVKVTVRRFLSSLIAGSASELVAQAGLPFMMEDRRLEKADDLRNEWTKHLRARRTDLLTLFDIEVLTPSEMEAKYGRPPARLSGWNWRGSNTYVVVANLSGHATVLLLRQSGLAWQVVGFHD